MVAAGSVVLCGSVLPDADVCGVAFRVAMDAHFASHSGGLPCPCPERFFSSDPRLEGVSGGRVRRVVRDPGERPTTNSTTSRRSALSLFRCRPLGSGSLRRLLRDRTGRSRDLRSSLSDDVHDGRLASSPAGRHVLADFLGRVGDLSQDGLGGLLLRRALGCGGLLCSFLLGHVLSFNETGVRNWRQVSPFTNPRLRDLSQR